jgi:hydrogenase maturation factor HypF (carbamoyltransferase family)
MGEKQVVLTGGCVQNGYLAERTVRRLQAEGLRRPPTTDHCTEQGG